MPKKQLLVEVISQSQRTDTTVVELINEGINTFSKKQDHFTGQLRKYNPTTEDDLQLDSEDSLVVTNVSDKLNYILKQVVESIDLNLTKENSNASAIANIEVEGNVWAENVPVNAILTAETRIKRLRNLLLAIPTLEPKEKWTFSKEHSPALYSSETKTRMKTKKVEKFITVAEATDKHPAQVQAVSNDVVAGIWETTLLSGKIKPSTKSKILARLDKLSGIFQNARESANMAEVKELKLGQKIHDYLMEPLNQDLK
jgi:hypothetical protein